MDQSQIEVVAKPESPYQHHFDQVSLQEKSEVLDYARNQREGMILPCENVSKVDCWVDLEAG